MGAAVELHRLPFSLIYKSISLAQHFMFMFISPSASQALHLVAEHHKIQPDFSEYSAKKAGGATMISAKRLAQMAKKWQRMAAMARKRLTSTPGKEAEGSCSASTSVAGKGHRVVYSSDGRRFEVPLAYLGTAVFGELLSMSQEEFGFAVDDGKIRLPCDAAVMEYVMCLLRRDASEEVIRAFLSSMVRPCHHIVPSMGLVRQSTVCV
ncbi:hypothetical protein BS78_02G263400 [Paspalum vaginatum]|nr:hypothetical protein BS78_02G263400 [Paspalum vaginatum]